MSKPPKQPPVRFNLVLETHSDGAVLRLKAALKSLGRRFDFRAIEVRPAVTGTQPSAADKASGGHHR